jgi:hypothetical protein
MVVIFFEFYVFGTSTKQTKQTATDPYLIAYSSEFNNTPTPTPSYNYSFSPPVSMYHALVIALESGGWNATSLKNMKISVGLDYCAFGPDFSFQLIRPVISPAADWSPQQINNVTYRYVWTIIIEGPGNLLSIPPAGLYYVDAATAELIPTGIL